MTSVEKNVPRWTCDQVQGAFSQLVFHVGVSSQVWVKATPGLEVLGAVRNQTKQAMRSQPVSHTPP